MIPRLPNTAGGVGLDALLKLRVAGSIPVVRFTTEPVDPAAALLGAPSGPLYLNRTSGCEMLGSTIDLIFCGDDRRCGWLPGFLMTGTTLPPSELCSISGGSHASSGRLPSSL